MWNRDCSRSLLRSFRDVERRELGKLPVTPMAKDLPGDNRRAASDGGVRFRHVLSHFATGVTVVTARTAWGPVGLAVNSFTSVSLEPPLIACCVSRSSSTWPHIRASGSFCVNILSEDQQDVCRTFAAKGVDRFRDVPWRQAPSRSPVLAGALAWIDCDVRSE